MTTNEKLASISLVMSDAYYFIRFRYHVELIEEKASQGDELAREFMKRLETMYRLAALCLK